MVTGLHALVSAKTLPFPGNQWRDVIYIRSFEKVHCPNQKDSSFDTIDKGIVTSGASDIWVPEVQGFDYSWWVKSEKGSYFIHNHIYFKIETNDGFEQYRFTRATWTDERSGEHGACQLQK